MRNQILTAALLCAACSSEAAGPSRNGNANPIAPGDGTPSAMQPDMMAPNDFGNPEGMAQAFDAGPVQDPSMPAGDCSPGLYLGTYECEITLFGLLPVPLAGDVSFNLSINESTVERECDETDEFCSDLVISENGGTLFGLAGFVGFETKLQGALDCSTGEFRASGVDGRWGNAISTDPNDPDALWTVEDPPMGMFDGELSGMHEKNGASETIAGSWDLTENTMDITCAGPFTVTLQP